MSAMAVASPTSLQACEPRWATPRRPERRTRGHEVAAIASRMGMPLMPWQRRVIDVALELDDDGLPAYRYVVVTVPRQQGKTTLLLGTEMHRALMWADKCQRVYYSAQTGLDGRKKLVDDQMPIIEMSPLHAAVKQYRRGIGSEGIIFRNRSRIDVMASSEHSGHGPSADLAIVDEAFSDVDDRREQAMVPSMMTKRDAQLWVTSTAGHEGSTYLRQKVDAGRAAVADGLDRGTCYFEWSAPDDADIKDPATWYSCMPALGITVSESVVMDALLDDLAKGKEGLFRRAFLNQWTVAEERVIPAAMWARVCVPGLDLGGSLVFGVDVSADRGHASIVAVDPQGCAELVEHREGTGWIADRVVELVARWDGEVVADERGPVAPILPEIESRGVPVVRYGSGQVAAACGRIFDAIADATVQVRAGSAALDAAVAGARKGIVGDAWYWRRRDAKVDISPLVALTVAFDRAAGNSRSSEPWFVLE